VSVSISGEHDVSRRKWALVLTEASVSISGEWALVSAGVSVGDERALVLVRESVVLVSIGKRSRKWALVLARASISIMMSER